MRELGVPIAKYRRLASRTTAYVCDLRAVSPFTTTVWGIINSFIGFSASRRSRQNGPSHPRLHPKSRFESDLLLKRKS